MPSYQAIVKVSSAGTAVAIQSPTGQVPGAFIAHGAVIQALRGNTGIVTIGTSAVTKYSATPNAYMFDLLKTESQELPHDCAVDLTQLYVNADTGGDGISIGWWN